MSTRACTAACHAVLMPSPANAIAQEQVHDIAEEIDEDGSGLLDYEAFLRWWLSMPGTQVRCRRMCSSRVLSLHSA